jgi:hypothetical protein
VVLKGTARPLHVELCRHSGKNKIVSCGSYDTLDYSFGTKSQVIPKKKVTKLFPMDLMIRHLKDWTKFRV